ncbi:MAG TPA: prenyltransferase/squalene oxidase repeat-containing protein, partial [Tepidisphaeraceae bacterium]
MLRRFAPLLLCISAALPALAQTTRPDILTRSELAEKSAEAINRGVKFLLSQQNTDGSWSGDRTSDREGGRTALITLALLSSGESYQSPPLEKAIKFLKTAQPQKALHATYSVALRACVFAELPDPLHNAELRSDLRWLEDTLHTQGETRGMYSYGRFFNYGGDFSNSQYGVLGVWYAAQVGLEVPRSYWKQVENAWHEGQNPDGGWGYRPADGHSYASMTAAAAATLYITNDYLTSRESADLNRLVINKPLDDAMKWLGENFAVDVNAGRDTELGQPHAVDNGVLNAFGQLGRVGGFYVNYMLFGFERVGEASGLTRFGTHKWFDEGADYLIRTQAVDGS